MSLYKAKLNPFTGDLQLVYNGSLIKIKESVDTYNNLPITNNSENDLRITQDTDKMYTWSISASSGILANWNDLGSVSSVDWSAITNKPSSAVADIDDAVAKKHTQNTDTILDEGGANEVTAEQLRTLVNLDAYSPDVREEINMKLLLPADVIHTDTDPDSLNTAIQALNNGDVIEVNSSAVYNPISIPANKALIIRTCVGKCINLTGAECIKLMNGARDTLISGVAISNCTSPAGNERGAGISFGEHEAIVSNIIFYNISIDTVINGSGVMLSYHWTVGGDTYFTPNTLSECSSGVKFVDCCFYKANKDNIEGGSLALRGVIGAYILNCQFRDGGTAYRQISLQNCINAYIVDNNIRNVATPGTNGEGIKIDEIGSCVYRSSAYVSGNTVKNATEGIDIDDNVDAMVIDNVCFECIEEGISVDDTATAVIARNLCYNNRYNVNSSGIRIENGAIVSLHENNCVNNITDYKIENGYILPTGNSTDIRNVVLRDSSRNLPYSGSIVTAFNVYEAIESLYSNTPSSSPVDIDDAVDKKHTQGTDQKLDEGGANEKSAEDIVISDADGDLKKITKLRYNDVTGEMVVYYEE